ncbi:MAG: hypothetical protein HGA71_15020 [Azonexaceae bacterium]|nr:hypothetical protein [Azonexaceae bacterium]
MAKTLVALLSGLIFGFGLIASGMSNPGKVKGFLDLAGQWDPSLALVMAGACGVALVPFAWARQRTTSWLGAAMPDNSLQSIDRRLLIGSALFGVGWGLSGFCPGPAVVGLGAGYQPGIVFVIAMLLGMVTFEWRLRRGVAGARGDE